jgi:dTDP-D-glucose 4,6-dehydratase
MTSGICWSAKINNKLGWVSRTPFKQGFHETVSWYRQNEAWWQSLLQKLQVNEGAWSSNAVQKHDEYS